MIKFLRITIEIRNIASEFGDRIASISKGKAEHESVRIMTEVEETFLF